jgi:hypothetical protein
VLVLGVTNPPPHPTPPHPTFWLLASAAVGVPTWNVRWRKREMNEASALGATTTVLCCYPFSFPNARTILMFCHWQKL